ncbi:MAG: hypothetical protein Q8M07_00720 [Prosthecobacter sp.]|nr:hypothetical protein [Prosthecobacter sp.]
MHDSKGVAPWHLWVVGIIALLFNSIGAFDYVMSMTQGASYQASVGMTSAQIAHYQNLPMWMKVVWPTGVWTAEAASVLILLRRSLAFPIFVVSLTAFLISVLYTYVLSDGGAIMGPPMAITSAVITGLLMFFIWYTRAMTRRGVLT